MDIIITLFLRFIRFISISLSFNNRRKVAILLSRAICYINPKRLLITIENLKAAFPEQTDDWIEKTARKAFESLAITYLEGLAQKSFTEETTRKIIRYKNPELINQLHALGKGVVLLSAHYGNWELISFSSYVYTKLPLLAVVVEQKYGSSLLNESRTAMGMKIVAKDKAARELIKTIKSGGCIAMLVDQSADKDKDIFVDFFGRPAVTYRAPADIALKFGAPLAIGFADRQPDGTYDVEIIEIKHDDLTYSEQSVAELTRRHVKLLEDKIREHPEMWSWMHRRWKHKPNS